MRFDEFFKHPVDLNRLTIMNTSNIIAGLLKSKFQVKNPNQNTNPNQ